MSPVLRVAARAQLLACVGRGQLEGHLSWDRVCPLVSLAWLLSPSVSVLPSLVHPPPDAMCAETSQPTPISHLLGRMWRIPSLGCVWRGAAVTAPEGSVEGGD